MQKSGGREWTGFDLIPICIIQPRDNGNGCFWQPGMHSAISAISGTIPAKSACPIGRQRKRKGHPRFPGVASSAIYWIGGLLPRLTSIKEQQIFIST